MDPSREKGLLVGYSETSKAYRVYIAARKRIIVSKDVQFDEDRALRRSMDSPAEQQPAQDTGIKLEEPDVQVQVQTHDTGSGSQRESGGQDPSIIDLEDELQQETDIQQPQQVDTRPRPKLFRSTIQDSRQVDPPQSSMRQRKPLVRLSYMTLMVELINSEPSNFEEAAQHDVWQEAMVEEMTPS